MTRTASLKWFAAHELRLAWRDWAALMSGGRKLRDGAIVLSMAVFALGLHALAYALLAEHLTGSATTAKPVLIVISAALALTFTMMLSQALEQVTRAFYSRDDLDLILSSPASSQDLFIVRIATMAATTAMMSALMVSPFINVAAILEGPHWLAAYPMTMACAALATAVAVALTLALFHWIGPKRTRLAAQITAAVIGASFLIGIQVVAILWYGSMSRFDLLTSSDLLAVAPAADSGFWMPARAAMGNLPALTLMIAGAAVLFLASAFIGARRFRHFVMEAMSLPTPASGSVSNDVPFRVRSPRASLIAKEWTLLARDPWLLSQSLMQILYLLPPALMLWVNFGHQTDLATIISPVIVMAMGQLAGGLAWLTISGEDAPDLVDTAPVSSATRAWAKVEAVLLIILAILLPLVAAIALISVWGAAMTMIGSLIAASCAILIQFMFRDRSKRSNFRRRQVASRTSTFCEAFASISCAGSTALLAAKNPIAVVPGTIVLIVMVTAWLLSPKRHD